MATKFLAITTRLVAHDAYDETRECLASDWGALFEREALFAPFLPLVVSYEIPFARYAPFVSGVILSGGNDLAACNDNPLSQKRNRGFDDVLLIRIALLRQRVVVACRQIIATA